MPAKRFEQSSETDGKAAEESGSGFTDGSSKCLTRSMKYGQSRSGITSAAALAFKTPMLNSMAMITTWRRVRRIRPAADVAQPAIARFVPRRINTTVASARIPNPNAIHAITTLRAAILSVLTAKALRPCMSSETKFIFEWPLIRFAFAIGILVCGNLDLTAAAA